MTFFPGKNPMEKKSVKLSSVTVEGTQLQTVGALDGMMFKRRTEKKATCQFNSMIMVKLSDDGTRE